MNLRNAIEAYANAVSSRDYYEIVGNGKQNAESMARLAVCSQSLDVVLAVAGAAMAIVEQQEAVDSYAFADAVMGRGELWEQYRAARDRAKDANQS